MRRLVPALVLALLVAAALPAAEPRSGIRLERPRARLVVSELMYHPVGDGPEFLELENRGQLPAVLGGAAFGDGIRYTFPAGRVLLPGEILVLTDDAATFRAWYPGVALEGEYSGRLANGGETVALEDDAGHRLLSVTWTDRHPWPAVPDGEGHSLVLCGDAPADPSSWRASTAYGGSPGLPEGGGCAWRDPTDALFDPDRILRVELTMAPQDWDALRNQGRNLFELLAGDCLTAPPASPFTTFPAAVTVDGATVAAATVRKKGLLGSLSVVKPSLKLRFDQGAAGGHLSGLTRMTLNNALQDPSFVNQCLSYGLFASAGLPAPRCSFATVAVNGEELGLYVHVESVDTPFLARHFSSRSGNLYEGTLSDFRPQWLATFERQAGDPDRADLEAVLAAAEVPDDALEEALDAVLDLDAFFTFWAAETLLGHWDGYAGNTNNFFVYAEPADGRLRFVPWGADATLRPPLGPDGAAAAPAVLTTGVLAYRLYLHPPTRARYVARILELLDTVWNEDALGAEIDRMEALIAPVALEELGSAFTADLAAARGFVSGRRAEVRAALQPSPPMGVAPLRELPCWTELGIVEAGIATSWGSLGADPFLAGSGSLHLQLEAQHVEFAPVGSVAGLDDASPPQATLAVAGVAADRSVWIVLVATDPARIVAGARLALDWQEAIGILAVLRPGRAEPEVVALVGNGVLELGAAGTVPGETVTGTLEAILYQLPF